MGIYVGAAATACLWSLSHVVSAFRRVVVVTQDVSPAPRTILLISALPTAVTLLFEWTTGHTPGNWTRAVSGVPLGATVAWIVSGLDLSQANNVTNEAGGRRALGDVYAPRSGGKRNRPLR
jgi:hypothetical protein